MKDMIQSGKTKNSSLVTKEFFRLANEFFTNDSKKKLSVVPLVKAVSKAGIEKFKLEEHHCPIQFLNQLMDFIAKEHKQQPDFFLATNGSGNEKDNNLQHLWQCFH